MKTLDMADKYPPAESFDEETTVRVQVPSFYPKVTVESLDFDLHGERDTIPCAPPYPQPWAEGPSGYEEVRYPGVGILLCLGMGLVFWGTIAYIIFH